MFPTGSHHTCFLTLYPTHRPGSSLLLFTFWARSQFCSCRGSSSGGHQRPLPGQRGLRVTPSVTYTLCGSVPSMMFGAQLDPNLMYLPLRRWKVLCGCGNCATSKGLGGHIPRMGGAGEKQETKRRKRTQEVSTGKDQSTWSLQRAPDGTG